MNRPRVFCFAVTWAGLFLSQVAVADVTKGTIDGFEWSTFSRDAQYGLVIGYALGKNLSSYTATQLLEGVNSFYSRDSNKTRLFEEAIDTAYGSTYRKSASLPNTKQAEPLNVQDSNHWKAGGSAYKDYTLPQNQPIPQPSYQQQQINNGNGAGRYGNYPRY